MGKCTRWAARARGFRWASTALGSFARWAWFDPGLLGGGLSLASAAARTCTRTSVLIGVFQEVMRATPLHLFQVTFTLQPHFGGRASCLAWSLLGSPSYRRVQCWVP